MRRPAPLALALLLAAVLLAGLVATGCGSGNATPGGGDSSSSSTSTESTVATGDTTGAEEEAPEVAIETAGPEFNAARVFEEASPGVVTIRSIFGPTSAAEGSGFVLNDEGEIVTNAHVVTEEQGQSRAPAEEVFVEFSDHNVVEAKIVGFDPFADVALLRIDPRGLKLRPLPLGSGSDVRAGAPVAAIGSPFGEEQSMSVGIVSAINRSIDSLTAFSTSGVIQTDAAVNHGNSGGPLLDARGRVLGINSQIQSSSGEGSGVGFAIPITVVRNSIDQLRDKGKVSYAYLGMTTRRLYPQAARAFKLPVEKGIWVQEVVGDGPAGKAGVVAKGPRKVFQHEPWATGGDILVGVGDTRIVDEADLSEALLKYAPGDQVTLHMYRDGRRKDVRVTLGSRPLQAAERSQATP